MGIPSHAGPELDAVVAEKVMGSVVFQDEDGWVQEAFTPGGQRYGLNIPSYSTDITAAWQVFKTGIELVGWGTLTMDMEDYGREPGDIATVEVGDCSATADAPLAICLAVLGACGHWINEPPD